MNIAGLTLENPVVLAPMAGITDLPYRRIMKEFGAALVFSEMISANGAVRHGRKTLELARTVPEERPLALQIFGDEPDNLAATAKQLAADCDLIDVNCGCPVNKVVRSGAGSALMRTPAQIGRIVAAIRKVVNIPLTIKIRSGWDQASSNFLEVARIAVAEGADAITLHPRTRSQGFGGKADWSQVRELKARIEVPVIGSGDIFCADDALRRLSETGCDAIMIGRGGYGNPWLIQNILSRLQGNAEHIPCAGERLEIALRHIRYHEESFGPKKTAFEMRKHLCWYSRGMSGAAEFRQKVNRANSGLELVEAAKTYFSLAAEHE